MAPHVPANVQNRLLDLADGLLSYGTILDHKARRGQFAPNPDTRPLLTRSVDNGESISCLQRVCDFIRVASFKASLLLHLWHFSSVLSLQAGYVALDGYRLRRERACHVFRSGSLTIWVCICLIGVLTAMIACLVDISDMFLFDHRYGYCRGGLTWNKTTCCTGADICNDWTSWSDLIRLDSHSDRTFAQVVISSCLGVALAFTEFKTIYSAAGSGVAQVKLMSKGIELPGWFDAQTLVYKVVGVILGVASGLNVGKEGPFVHIATCIGGIVAQIAQFDKSDRRLLMNVGAATGLSIAFGAPIAGIMFSLEELRNELSPNQLVKTFFCCIIASLSLKSLNPYGTNKAVMFEVHFMAEWKAFELPVFVFLGFVAGIFGALVVKASRVRPTFSQWTSCNVQRPIVEVLVVALLSDSLSFWNPFTRNGVASTLTELATPCNHSNASDPPSIQDPHGHSLCPTMADIPTHITTLLVALTIKAFLTVLSFSLEVPAGIYVPSMVLGALLGKCLGHALQFFIFSAPRLSIFVTCASASTCITPGAYALAGAGALVCGVTRLPITLAVALLEISRSTDYAIPFSLAMFAAKWSGNMVEPETFYDVVARAHGYPWADEDTAEIPVSEGTTLHSSSRTGSVRLGDEEVATPSDADGVRDEQTEQRDSCV